MATESLLEFALDAIRESIQIGKYKQGTKLLPTAIATELEISVTPVKEAINRLVSEGLAVAVPRRGQFVVKLSAKKIREVMAMRLMLESFAAKTVVQNATNHKATLIRMEECVKAHNLLEDEDYRGLIRLEASFHKDFISLAENTQLSQFFFINWNISAIFLIEYMKKVSILRRQDSLAEHSRLLKYIKEGNTKALIHLVENHFNYVEEMIEVLYK